MKRRNVDRRVMLAGLGTAVAGSLLARRAVAGDLEPPGPVGPTGRRLADIEPRRPVNGEPSGPGALHVISVGGSLTLTGDLVVTAGQVAILITTRDPVSIDLRGFSIRGGGGGGGGGGGILVQVPAPGPGSFYVEIYDGYIRDMDGDGINGGTAQVLECNDLHISHVSRGIVGSASLTIEGCVVDHCTSHGIVWDKTAPSESRTCIVDDTEVRACGGHGVAIIGDWNGDGIDTVAHTVSITSTDCVGNTLDGLHIDLQSTLPGASAGRLSALIQDVQATANGARGVDMQSPPGPVGTGASLVVQLEDVVCTRNAAGGMRCADLTADMIDCMCSENADDGFLLVNSKGSIDGCVATGNAGDGIHCQGSGLRWSMGYAFVVANNGAGVHLDASCSGSTVTECDAQGNGTGFQIDSPANLLLWNTASGNGTNYAVQPTMAIVIVTPNDLATSSITAANYSFP